MALPARELLHGREDATFHKAEVTGIDLDARRVLVTGMAPIDYDYLVLALGAVVNFFGTGGAPENAIPLYTLEDAVRLKAHILDRFEAADRDPGVVDDGALTFCVVGGGATGVETAGAISELLRAELSKDYPNLPVERAEVHLFELGAHVLGPFKPNLQNYAQSALEKRGVEVHLGEGVVKVEPTRVHLRSGAVIKAHTLVWAAGLRPNPIVQSMALELDHGRPVAGPDLSLEGHPEVFVVGDLALIRDTKTGDLLPQLGSVALQAGEHAGENIRRLAEGKPPEPFVYKDKGTMATVGRGAAVVEFRRGKTMTGKAAWLAWMAVHLTLLSGGEEKALTTLDWGWSLFTHGRRKGVIVR